MAGDVRDAVEHLQRILDGLLLWPAARPGSPHGTPATWPPSPPPSLDAAAARAAAARRHRTTPLRPAPVTGEPVLLERLIGNLVDNAIRYNHAGGHLTVDHGTADGRAVLRICNTGREITPEEAQTLLEPFVRGAGHPRPHRRPGLGLGLSIVRAIIPAHHGHIAVTARPGGGLDITIDLPHHSRDRRAVATTTLRSQLTPGVHHARGNTKEPSR